MKQIIYNLAVSLPPPLSPNKKFWVRAWLRQSKNIISVSQIDTLYTIENKIEWFFKVRNSST
jgi:hypothetical protein